MTAAAAELLSELEAADGCSPERWDGILDRTTRLFLSCADGLTASQIDLFDSVFLRLMDRVGKQSLARFGQNLSTAKHTLPQTARRLAFDQNESVSLPILKSRAVTVELLLDVVESAGRPHRLAMASRHTVEPALSEVLMRCGEPAVHHALVDNLGAQMSDPSWARLAQLGESDHDLAKKLSRRSDMPVLLKRKIQAKLEDARMRLLQAKPRAMREQIEHTVASRHEARIELNSEPVDLEGAHARMVDLNRKGKLNDSTINRFAVRGEYVEVTAALALLTGSPTEVIRTLIASEEVGGLVLACKAARLDWATTVTIVKNRPDLPPVSAGELEKAKETFESFSLSAAQRTVRF